MTRARCVLGAPALQARFEQIRESVISSPRDAAALAAEIVAMRERVRKAHPVKDGQFDVKHSPGGMVDVEFAVQFLVLSQASIHPGLLQNAGNIALLLRIGEVGLVTPEIALAAADAYRELRRVQHHARLNEASTQVPAGQLDAPCKAILALWAAVFGANGAARRVGPGKA